MRWAGQVFSLELRKTLSYRLDFWVQFLTPIVGQMGVSYFLWQAVFEAREVQTLGGMSFKAFLLYYLCVALVDKIVLAGWRGGISNDIYEGSLSRYLVYPVSFFGYRLAIHFAGALFSVLQLLLVLLTWLLIFGAPPDLSLSAFSVAGGVGTAVLTSLLCFCMNCILDFVAFWADNVWSLQVMLRFAVQLLGGAMIPLSLFPERARQIVSWLPFPALISLPVRTLLGQVTWSEWTHAMLVALVWTGVFIFVMRVVWRRGLRQYSGVGL